MTIGILGILTMKGIFAYSFWVSIHVWDYEFDHHERAGSQIRKSGINRLRLRRRRRRPINCWKCPSCLLHTLVSELKMKRWSFCLPQVWLYESKTEKSELRCPHPSYLSSEPLDKIELSLYKNAMISRVRIFCWFEILWCFPLWRMENARVIKIRIYQSLLIHVYGKELYQ